MRLSRREFLAASAAAGSAAAVPAVRGAEKNRRYKTALVGTGWWGMNILREAIEAGQSSVVAMCDVDRHQLDPAAAEVEKLTGQTPKKYGDFRELLDKEKPEIVIVATPDHWHPLLMIAAVKAGAHVYVEKPISHTIIEGRAMVNAARGDRTRRPGRARTAASRRTTSAGGSSSAPGKLGKIGMVRAFVHYGGGPETATQEHRAAQGTGLGHVVRPGPAAARSTATRTIPGAAASTPAASAATSITPTARWATGASTGWTRSSGSPARSGPRRSSPPAAGRSKARPS